MVPAHLPGTGDRGSALLVRPPRYPGGTRAPLDRVARHDPPGRRSRNDRARLGCPPRTGHQPAPGEHRDHRLHDQCAPGRTTHHRPNRRRAHGCPPHPGDLQTRSRNAIRSSALQVVLEHLEELELRHDLAARILADTVEHPETATQQDQAEVAQRLRDAAATAHSTVDKILDSAIRTVADMQLTADREQHLAETRSDLADAIVSRVLDKSHRAAASTGPEAAWQDALEELLPADLAAERAIAIAATRSAAVDRRAARSQHPDIEKLLAKPEHPADTGSPPDLGA